MIFILLVMIQFSGQGPVTQWTGVDGLFNRAVPEKTVVSPANFTIPAAQSAQTYNAAILRWRDQNFSLWTRIVPSQNDEDMFIAYEGEAIRRGNYRAALAAVPPAFLNGDQRTYESSVYFGGMEAAARSFAAAEQEKIDRLSRAISENSLDFLQESHVFEFFATREYTDYINDGAALVYSIDPAALTLELVPAVLEGFIDLQQYRFNEDNPFERLADRSCLVISEGIRRILVTAGTEEAGLILVFQEDTADIEFNLRLGKALLDWATSSGNEEWSAVGRSIILSCLSLEDSLGMVPRALLMNAAGELSNGDLPRISSARLYRILRSGEFYPQATVVSPALNGIWAWTAAQTVSAAQEGDVLDIAVTFPTGETHYMMIRGVRPFSRLQLYYTDHSTDPQFERYDSSGWRYLAPDQILILKMRHRAAVEHVRIFYE
ncbi:hypothetical protein FACS189491_00650 [Spirochaetia bacterium]|nr:hypothetical protein FACS189491_00650 [Spirochaetia bacterium]